MPPFIKHQKAWFTNRVGKIVARSATMFTDKETKISIQLNQNIIIADKKHAEALFLHHLDKKINYNQL